MAILHDHHIHTVFSNHSAPDMLVGAIAARVRQAGLARAVVLEHVPEIPKYRRAVLKGAPRPFPRPQIEAIGEEIARWKADCPARLFLGAEVDADPLALDGSLLVRDREGIDVLVASTHYLPGVKALWYEAPDFSPGKLASVYRDWMTWALHVAANPLVDVLAHPGVEMASIGAIERFEGPVLEDFEKLLRVCRKYDTAVELNELFAQKVSPEQAASYVDVLALARDLGVRISVGSDAHELGRIGRYEWVQEAAERLGLGPEHYFHPRHAA